MISIGCRTRVGECAFEYTLLLEGWVVEGNKLRVPISETTKTKNFAINAVINDPTGEQIAVSLIVELIDGEIKIYEKQDFYDRNNYQEKK